MHGLINPLLILLILLIRQALTSVKSCFYFYTIKIRIGEEEKTSPSSRPNFDSIRKHFIFMNLIDSGICAKIKY